MPKRRADQATTAPQQPPVIHTINATGVYFADDVKRLFKLRNSTLRRELRLGRLRVAKRGRRYLFLGRWLIAWVEAGEVRPRHQNEANGQATQG